MLHIDIPTLAEFPGQLTSKMDERDNVYGTTRPTSSLGSRRSRLPNFLSFG